MGQTISYPPLDVVVYLSKFLWFEDIHAFTAVSHTIHDMIESESDLWRSLLSACLQRVLSIPFCLQLDRTDPALTKMLIRRTCDHPCGVDTLILRKHKGPDNVLAVENSNSDNIPITTIEFNPPNKDSYNLNGPPVVTRRTVVSTNHFPCLKTSSKCPRALVPFTKVMAVATAYGQEKKKHHFVNSPRHTASLSSLAYFEGTLLPSLSSKCSSCRSDDARMIPLQNKTVQCSIGIACAPFIIRSKLPGDDSFSFGYTSGTGRIIQSGRMQCAPGQRYSTGDTVGCGLIYPLKDTMPGYIFFTKNGILQNKMQIVDKKFFSIAWFPVMGVATAEHSSISLNFGIRNPFLFDINAFEVAHIAAVDRSPFIWQSLSAYYMHYIQCASTNQTPSSAASSSIEAQRLCTQELLATKYISHSTEQYIKKDTYSLFANNTLLHETMAIMDPKTYKSQGTIVSDSEEDSSDDEG